MVAVDHSVLVLGSGSSCIHSRLRHFTIVFTSENKEAKGDCQRQPKIPFLYPSILKGFCHEMNIFLKAYCIILSKSTFCTCADSFYIFLFLS